MFENVTQSYNLNDASWEIFTMLLVSFMLGFLFYWAFFDNECENKCCRKKSTALDADDLKVVEGIGPKIEQLLNDAEIFTFADLAEADYTTLKKILDNAGPRFKMHEPKTWPEQATMAENGQWDKLKEYQDFLIGGKDHA